MEYAGLSIPMLAEKAVNGLDHLFAYASGMRRIPVTHLGRYCVETGYPIDPRIFAFLNFATSEQMKSKLTEDLKEAKPLSEAAMQLIDQIVQLDRDGSFDARTVAAFNCQVELARKYPFVPSHCG